MRIFLVSLFLLAGPAFGQSQATYTVTFESTWSASTHPEGFPGNPHFSGLVGATHRSGTHLWMSGGLASPGIELMAETGGKSTLLAEVDGFKSSGMVEAALSGDAIGSSPGSATLTFDVFESHAFVTLVSMIAPSPDWFVGVDGLALRDGTGWISEIVVPLDVFDAGTDDGPEYTSANDDTNPPETIAKIEASPFKVGDALVPVGTFTFTLQSSTTTEDDPTDLELSAAAPNPASSFTALTVVRPDASPMRVEVFDGLGRLVATPQIPPITGRVSIQIDTEGWAPGVYHARVSTDSVTATRRFVIQR